MLLLSADYAMHYAADARHATLMMMTYYAFRRHAAIIAFRLYAAAALATPCHCRYTLRADISRHSFTPR